MRRSSRTGAPGSRGFSMVEMLASLVIFSILALLAVPAATTYRDRQTEVILKDRLGRIRFAIDSFARSELATVWDSSSPCSSSNASAGDIDGDGVSGEDPAGDANGDGLSDDDFDGNVDEDGAPIYPRTLQALVDRGYLGAPFPRDPTNLDLNLPAIATWRVLRVTRSFRFVCPATGSLETVEYTGIYDVRSSSDGISISGMQLSEF